MHKGGFDVETIDKIKRIIKSVKLRGGGSATFTPVRDGVAVGVTLLIYRKRTQYGFRYFVRWIRTNYCPRTMYGCVPIRIQDDEDVLEFWQNREAQEVIVKDFFLFIQSILRTESII